MRAKTANTASPEKTVPVAAPATTKAKPVASTSKGAKKPQKPRTKADAAKTPPKAPSPPVTKKRKQPAKATKAPAPAPGAAVVEQKKKRKVSISAPSPTKKAKKDSKLDKSTTVAPDSSGSKDDKKPGKDGATKPAKEGPPVDPYKQVSTAGVAPVPVILLARRDDVTQNFRKNFPLAPRKSRAKPRPFAPFAPPLSGTATTGLTSATTSTGARGTASNGMVAALMAMTAGNPVTATGDARVALRVLPGGQIPPQRSKRPNDTLTETTTAGGAKKKARIGRPPSASASSGAALGSQNHRGKLSSNEWHRGMYSVNGMTLIEPNLASAVPPPPPLVQADTPPRYRRMRHTITDLLGFDKDDDTRASIQYLRCIALCVGRLGSSLPGRLQNSFNQEHRIHKERLTRVLFARDGRHADKVPAGGTRRSSRARVAPDMFVPTTIEGNKNSVYGYRRGDGGYDGGFGGEYGVLGAGGIMIQPFDPTELTDVRVGPMYQTELPQQRPCPKIPDVDESRWIENLVLEAGKEAEKGGKPVKNSKIVERPEFMARACEDEGHAEAIARQVSHLTATVGPVVAEAFGLGTMGTETAKNLTEEQQEQLYNGITQHGRGFFKISREFLGNEVRPRVLAAYYYDVWKLSGIPAAKRWFNDKVAEEERRIAEAKAQEILRAEEAAKRAKSSEASNRRRHTKEAFQWLRGAAKNPFEANFNKSTVRERVSRILRVHRELAEALVGAPTSAT